MKLYSSAISPYAARCRILIQHKQAPVEILAPPGGMGSDEIKALNPSGKIPVLDLGASATGHQAIAESWAILEYLESHNPEPAMRPADAFSQAKQVELVRFTDLYLAPAMFPLFLALRGKADESAVKTALSGLQQQFQTLEKFLATQPSDPAIELSLADAALLPVVWYARILARHFGLEDCLTGLPITTQWWQRCSAIAAAASVLSEMETGLKLAIPPLFEND